MRQPQNIAMKAPESPVNDESPQTREAKKRQKDECMLSNGCEACKPEEVGVRKYPPSSMSYEKKSDRLKICLANT
jgi:hypothetical protein